MSSNLFLTVASALVATAACKGDGTPSSDPMPVVAAPSTAFDAGSRSASKPQATTPASASDGGLADYHLDDDPLPVSANHRRTRRSVSARPIEIILRSTPPGATAAVDGQPIGKTPTFWAGSADGRPRDFTFSLKGFSVARYRFVPTKGGIVHGTLRRVIHALDAGPE